MIENHAVTCTFGVRPRVRRPVGRDAFGTADAIGPHFGDMPPAEAKAAIAMMTERGHSQGEMATACDCSEADIRRIVSRVCRPVPAPGGRDDTRGAESHTSPPRRRHAPADLDRALRLIAAHAVAGGAALDERFLITLDTLSGLLEGALGLARDRARALMAAGLIDWRMPPGQPGSMMITGKGRLRLEAMGFPPESAALPAAWAERRSARTSARGRATAQAAEGKALRMLVVLDRLRADAGVGPACGFAASVATIIRAANLIDKTARNHLDLVIRLGWVDRDASAGRCATLTITPAGRAALDTGRASGEGA